ncbi:MAG TPA: MBL fold metallo-hydrolase [Candidatus Nanoarchaeia archaeon]|nr:MBL fold metallo-hydrolase [Candidatus Nanoarchaeia archaeon]
MKLTKFPQSCILIETTGKRILVDPGYLQYDSSWLNREWAKIDLILITHKHKDHCHVEAIKEILKNKTTLIYTSKEVAETYPELAVKTIKSGESLTFGGIKIDAVKAVHGYLPLLKGGNEIKENMGFILADGKKKVYLTGDTLCFENGFSVDLIFLPVCNHGLVMGVFEAALFAKETGAKTVIPYHYDNPKYPVDLEEVKREFEKQNLNCKILVIGETITV